MSAFELWERDLERDLLDLTFSLSWGLWDLERDLLDLVSFEILASSASDVTERLRLLDLRHFSVVGDAGSSFSVGFTTPLSTGMFSPTKT